MAKKSSPAPKAAERPYAEIDGVKVNPLLAQHLVHIDSLVPDPDNARLHSDRNLKAIQASLERVGFQSAVLYDPATQRVVVGNGRLEAAKGLGWSSVPALPFRGTPEEIRAYAIADNQTAALGEWNNEKLAESLRELQIAEFPIQEFGFYDFELEGLLNPSPVFPETEDAGDGLEGEPAGEVKAPGPDYALKLVAPIYEIKGKNPGLDELIDYSRVSELKVKIRAAKLPPDVETFLHRAAERFAAFNYGLIAEYYAHNAGDSVLKGLIEDLALVVVDYNRALELGLVRLSDRLLNLSSQEALSGTPEDRVEESEEEDLDDGE